MGTVYRKRVSRREMEQFMENLWEQLAEIKPQEGKF